MWEHLGIYRCVLFSESKSDIAPYLKLRPDAVGILYFEEVAGAEDIAPDPELMEIQATEGRQKLVEHLLRERKRGLVVAKRNEVRAACGHLICQSCGLTEAELPNELGEASFEVHHKNHLSQIKGPVQIKLKDMHVLCANCHRMIHRSKPMLTPAKLQKRLKLSAVN